MLLGSKVPRKVLCIQQLIRRLSTDKEYKNKIAAISPSANETNGKESLIEGCTIAFQTSGATAK
jgi:hypothetical protein